MKTLHINRKDNSGRIYCYKYDSLVGNIDQYVQEHCEKCQYFKGYEGMQIATVSCLFDDASKVDEISFDDAGDSEFHSKMQYHRLGMATKEEVLARLQSFNDYSDPEPVTKEGEEDIPVDTGEEE